ncbi:hypothetical protein BDD26_3561 [Xenorhabdus cabanillasii]|uniref:Uncharacterized protein n=1 Tax=Xenorhabdus cabanillasii TaxID=351673 RepID=A0A3D9UGP5_9GAMM|nr:hypothetical protein [Xenorhabdus cabanillasii]REF28622.1 hypothetical protein BDD26_3561 [Xenorhabdus cabanillasii]
MNLIKAALLMIVTAITLPSVVAENKKYESMLNVSDNYYMDINNGKIFGIYYAPKLIDKDDKPWMGCSNPFTRNVTVISTSPDERTIDTFKVKDSEGDYETYDISSIYKDIPNYARGYIRYLIKQDAKIKLTSRVCGSGAFPTFVAAER